MTREDFIDLLEFRDFILERADMLIDAGFSIDSAVLNNFYETANGIVSRMEQNLKLGKIAGNYTVLSWALESLDAGNPFVWEIDGKKYKGHDFADLWRHLQDEIRSKGKK